MLIVKGFFTYAPLVDNTIDYVAKLGELSSHSSTYSKDKQYYTHESTPLTTLITFHSVREGNVVELDPLFSKQVLSVGNYLFERALAGLTGSDGAKLIQDLLTEFSGAISEVRIGSIITDNSVSLPEWVEFQIPGDVANSVRVWFADESFRNQYDETIIEIVAPTKNLDDFFLSPDRVNLFLNQYNVIDTIQGIQAIRGEYPFTLHIAQRYDYYNPLDRSLRTPSYWILLVYGQAGNNPDRIKHALIDYILENSSHTREEWEVILPDLFMTTEFIITPLWHQYAIPNLQLQAGINSPIIRPGEHLDLLVKTTKGSAYSENWIKSNAEFSSNLYKSIAFGVVGSPSNRDGLTQLSELFPDYILVTNNSADFNRVSPYTQEWMVLLSKMFSVAEGFTNISTVPLGFSRVVRDGVTYLTTTYDSVTFMMVAKPSLTQLITGQEPGTGVPDPGPSTGQVRMTLTKATWNMEIYFYGYGRDFNRNYHGDLTPNLIKGVAVLELFSMRKGYVPDGDPEGVFMSMQGDVPQDFFTQITCSAGTLKSIDANRHYDASQNETQFFWEQIPGSGSKLAGLSDESTIEEVVFEYQL